MPGTFLQNRIKVGLANIRCNKNNLTRPNLKKGRLKSIPEEGYVTDLVLIFEGNIFLLKIPNRSAKLRGNKYSFSSLLLARGCPSGGGGLNRPQERKAAKV